MDQDRENPRIVMRRHAPEKKELARSFRRDMTDAETFLWAHLRANRLANLHFRRQQILFGFIADFYCHPARLAIEVDGGVHEEQAEYDADRAAVLASQGILVLRFTNDQVLHSIHDVLSAITVAANERNPIA